MDSINFFLDFTAYETSSVIIGAAVAVVLFLADKFLSGKLSLSIKGYIPFISGIALYFVYSLLFLSATAFSVIIPSGLLCGSIGTVIFAFIKNLKIGKHQKNLFVLAVENALRDIIKTEFLHEFAVSALEIMQLNSQMSAEEISALIAEAVRPEISAVAEKETILTACLLAVNAVNALK